MDPAAVLAAYDDQMRAHPPQAPGVTFVRTPRALRQVGADGGWCAVVWSDLTENDADQEIAAQRDALAGLGAGAEWKHYSHDTPADLPERLLRAGFRAADPEALMVAEVATLPTEVLLPAGVRLERVTDEAGIAAMVRACGEAFGTDRADLGRAVAAQLKTDPDGTMVAVLWHGDRPLTAGRLELPAGRDFASVWGGGTVPDWRHRGLYRALLAHRTAIAAERGYRYLQVDASPDSEPILTRLGFQRLATTTPYVLRP